MLCTLNSNKAHHSKSTNISIYIHRGIDSSCCSISTAFNYKYHPNFKLIHLTSNFSYIYYKSTISTSIFASSTQKKF